MCGGDAGLNNLRIEVVESPNIDRWTLDESYGLAAVFSQRPLEIHRCDKPVGRQAQAAWLFPELGQIDAEKPQAERQKQLAALMTHPENGRFTRTIVNRLWYKLMGRGIVHPLELSAEKRRAWAVHLADYEVQSPFMQLGTTMLPCAPVVPT